MNNSEVIVHKPGGTSFVGPDAVRLFQAITLVSAIKLYIKIGMVPTRGIGITKMLRYASAYTGKEYKRGKTSAATAVDDLQVWVDTMKAAIPINQPDNNE